MATVVGWLVAIYIAIGIFYMGYLWGTETQNANIKFWDLPFIDVITIVSFGALWPLGMIGRTFN